jgi:hypothetical protein
MSEGTLDLRARARANAPAIEPGALAPSVIATWRGRMVNEYGSSHVFAGLAEQLAALGGRDDEAAQCERFAAEEREHGVLCGAVVEAAGGAAQASISAPQTLPDHADTTPRAAAVRNAISICCMSETIAVALIGAERLEMPEGPLRELLERIWADEIGHARFGWRYVARELAELTADERAAIERYLPVAFGHLEAHELAHIPLREWPAEGAAYGLCDGGDARTLFYETVDEVIVPQLTALGLSAAAAWQNRRQP